jgi:UDP-glucose:glycoprotein glucosyltransferase
VDPLTDFSVTHEPKLQRARRLIPEWSVYDSEVAELAKRIASREGSATNANAFAEEANKLEQAREQEKEFVEEGTGHAVEVNKVKEHSKDEL